MTLSSSVNPAKAALVAAQRRGMTFDKAMEHFLNSKLEGFQSVKHRAQWRASLEAYAKPALGGMIVADIAPQDVLRVLESIWTKKQETASRLRGRIEAVFAWATVAVHRTGDNPARWAMNLKELLPTLSKVNRVVNEPALQLDDAGRWFWNSGQSSSWLATTMSFPNQTALNRWLMMLTLKRFTTPNGSVAQIP